MDNLKKYPAISISLSVISILILQALVSGNDVLINGAMIQANWCSKVDYICLLRKYIYISLALLILGIFVQLIINSIKKNKKTKLTMPIPVSDFVGREQETEQIVQFLNHAKKGKMPAIFGIIGMGGIGKTQLAYTAAQRLAKSFYDAPIFVQLHGEAKNPPLPYQVLQTVIQDLDKQANLPDDLNALQARYRSLLFNKHTLIIADNAKDSAQVELLTPPSGSALLITSRRRFILPGMELMQLKPLLPQKSRVLLLKICPRIGADAPYLASLCGYLPLALRMSAYLLQIYDTRSVKCYLKELEDERDRLKQLRDPEDPNNPETSVEASIGLSYDALEYILEPAKKVFRQIGVFPGSFDSISLQAISDLPSSTMIKDSVELLRRHSLIELDTTSDRINLHDLVRAFARSRLSEIERANTERRYIKHYLTFAQTNCKNKDALEKEQANIMQGLEYAYIAWKENSFDQELSDLILVTIQKFGLFMSSKGSFKSRIEWGKKALEIAEYNDDLSSIANLCAYTISWSLLQQGDYKQVREYCDRGLKAALSCENIKIAGIAAHNRAGAERDLGEKSNAKYWAKKTLKFAQDSGDEQLRKYAVLDLGYANLLEKEINSYIEAETQFRELMEIERKDQSEGKGNDELLANRSMDVGLALLNQGKFAESRKLYEEAIQLGNKIAHLTIIGEAEFGLSKIERALGNNRKATKWELSAKTMFERAGVTRAARAEQFFFLSLLPHKKIYKI